MMFRKLIALSTIVVSTAVIPLNFHDFAFAEENMGTETTENPAPTTNETETKDIVSTAIEAGSFNTLATALEAAGLVELLQGEGPFTVFAPTDEAFAALPEGVLEQLLQPENKDLLVKILTYHVVANAKVMSSDITPGEVPTAEGSPIVVQVEDGKVMVNDSTVTQADIEASNGVIHVIDKVILPPEEVTEEETSK
jgi:uncharacterized surface protein with fasciclin (FAS1) repeats